ncbi:MAG TPA: endonuclease III [Candidatus Dojkabacteria bacterium]|nr:endonuclease III [Candidatus Dojkabacteria bacterium]HQF37027.1 endonuclease III [Candidatus Dojkabacteria bacterium]
MNNQILEKIIEILAKKYPNPQTPLLHRNSYELLIAVILSAQMTDKRLNTITPLLFEKYPTFSSLANANIEDVQKIISGVNYYKTKSQHIIEVSKTINLKYDDKIPETLDKLIAMPGIGRKTANVILNEGLNISEGIVVDTHVIRVSQRLGFTNNKTAQKIEIDLMKIIPKQYWRNISLWMIFHGRETCVARKPKCDECKIKDYCNYYSSLK